MKQIVTVTDLTGVNFSDVPTPTGNNTLKGKFVTDKNGNKWWVDFNGNAIQINSLSSANQTKLNASKVKTITRTNGNKLEIISTLGRKSYIGLTQPTEMPEASVFPTWDVNGEEKPFGTPIKDYPANLFGADWAFNGDADHNALLRRTLPNGEKGLVWVTKGKGENTADGGINTPYVNIDNTKKYRVSVWFKRNNNAGDSRVYMGLHGKDRAVLNEDGTENTNPYIMSRYTDVNGWCLAVGYIYPVGTEAFPKEGGMFKKGSMLSADRAGCRGFKFQDTTTSINMRFYQYYSKTEGTEIEFYQPIIEEITEDTKPLSELLLCSPSSPNMGNIFVNNEDIVELDGATTATILTTPIFKAKKNSKLKVNLSVPIRYDNTTSWQGAYINLNAKINDTWYNLGNGGFEKMLYDGIRQIDKIEREVVLDFPTWEKIEGDYDVQLEVTGRAYSDNVKVKVNDGHAINNTDNGLDARGNLYAPSTSQNFAFIRVSEC